MSGPGQIPTPPDPVKTAAAQEKQNVGTATAQYGLNATDQKTPYGGLTYKQVGTWPDGTPHFEATTSLSPEQEGIYNQYTDLASKFGGIAKTQLDNVSSTLGTPFNINTATADKLAGLQHEFLDPQWNTAEDRNYNRLANQGITPGSDAYNTATRNFSDSRSRAYDQMYIDAYGTAANTSLAERNQPFNELSALMSGTASGEKNPNFTNTPTSQLSTPDLAGMTYNSYQMGPLAQYQANNQYNQALMGGMFGLGGAALGGFGGIAGRGGFGNPFGVPINNMQGQRY